MPEQRSPAPRIEAEILSTRNFKKKFFECVSRNPISLRVASPNIGEIPSFKTIIRFAQHLLREEGVKFQIITRPPTLSEGTNFISLASANIIVNLGVDLLIRTNPALHSKVYHFEFRQGDQASFVGSANFSKGGFERNDETVAFFRDPEVNRKVEIELNRLAGFGSFPYIMWKAQNASKLKGEENG